MQRFTIPIFVALASACGRDAAIAPPEAPPPAAASAGITVDVFDTEPSTVERVVARHGDALRALAHDHSDARIDAAIDEIRRDGGYAYVHPAMVTYYEPRGETAYLTIDIVDLQDARRRMPFAPPPTGSYPDPGGLIATWKAYADEFHELVRQGARFKPPIECPWFHCLGDPRHPALRALADRVAAGVPGHVDELATILRDDRDATHRAAAAFVLAYATDGRTVVDDLVPALHDADATVRNNAMRVLAEIALHHPEVDVPVAPVLEALAYPATTDRNKASAILDRLLDHPGAAALYPRVIREAGRTLIAMLRLRQPNNHDFAYRILKKISGQVHGERDLARWEAWLARAEGTASP